MSELDPMTQVYHRLWQILESHEPFVQLVRPGNRLRTVSGGGIVKPSLQPADLPQVQIVPTGGTIDLFQTSTGSTFSQDYAILIRTGDRATDDRPLRIKWQIIRAFAAQGDELGLSDVTGVVRARLHGPGEQATGEPWKIAMRVAVQFRFETESLSIN